jgi:ABC-type multidrug transport system fused ATPase/permease subunit
MDRIIYLEHGKVVETGTFEALKKKKNGKFAKLWKLQQIEVKE